MVRRKVDPRIRSLIESGINNGHRSIFVIIGDHGRDQVVHLHYMLSKAQVAARPSLLWCYKKELGFSSHRKKRMKQLTKKKEKGLLSVDTNENMDESIFDRFLTTTDIRYCYYKESEKILGTTFGMCVLQDFEALTPNLLARTVETVQGGGIVILLLKTLSSLKQLYTMTMDVHSRYRTESHQEDIVSRFNERFLLSLSNCQSCLLLDDELNVLPISSYSRSMLSDIEASKSGKGDEDDVDFKEMELRKLKESAKESLPVAGALMSSAKTVDQAKAIMTFIDVISEKSLKSTVSLTASRGRGKSAALGLAISAAIAYGYSNIFVTSPHPDNLKTLFEFIFKGFDSLGYEEHLDYDMVQSTHPDLNKAIIRVNVFKSHRQTIQYIQPQDAKVLGQAELVVIDEAAAIPLPIVKSLLGSYLVFMASTINGYEGTGRSLSLKLIQQLREQSSGKMIVREGETSSKSLSGRSLKEIKLEEPIRYKSGDPIEAWLNQLLCLDASRITPLHRSLNPGSGSSCPHPSTCELYYVNRDTLFSYHKASESFLQKMMGLYVSSHYKNTPNDLQLMSDAPAHNLFVLLPPIPENSNSLPDILAVIQVCLEGEISKQTILKSLARGQRGGGDLIPWTLSQQFQDDDFPSLSGARIVRIATHPEYQKMGYGTRAIELLEDFYKGKMVNLEEIEENEQMDHIQQTNGSDLQGGESGIHNEKLEPKKNLPPLLAKLSERRPEALHWLGVSFGLTPGLLKFWKKSAYVPVYVRQTKNELTGEHTTIMLKSLQSSYNDREDDGGWLGLFYKDFYKRFLSLLSFQFCDLSPSTALDMLHPTTGLSKPRSRSPLSWRELQEIMSTFDLKRLESYANNMVDYHLIIDLLPMICQHYFLGKLPAPGGDNGNRRSSEGYEELLSPVQSAILIAIGCQKKSVDDLQNELNLQSSQILAIFIKIVRKVTNIYKAIQENAADIEIHGRSTEMAIQVEQEDEHDKDKNEDEKVIIKKKMKQLNNEEHWDPTLQSLDQDLEASGSLASKAFREKQQELISALDLQKFAIGGKDDEWDKVLMKGDKPNKAVSIKKEKNEKSEKEPKEGSFKQLKDKQATESQKRLNKGMNKRKL